MTYRRKDFKSKALTGFSPQPANVDKQKIIMEDVFSEWIGTLCNINLMKTFLPPSSAIMNKYIMQEKTAFLIMIVSNQIYPVLTHKDCTTYHEQNRDHSNKANTFRA